MSAGSDEQGHNGEVGLLAAALWFDPGDVDDNLEHLAAWLEATLPEATVVTRQGGRLRGRRRAVEVGVTLSDRAYVLRRRPMGLEATIGHRVHDVVIRTDRVDVPSWLAALTGSLIEVARENRRAEEALRELLD